MSAASHMSALVNAGAVNREMAPESIARVRSAGSIAEDAGAEIIEDLQLEAVTGPGIVFTTEDSKDVLMWGMPGVGRGASVGSMKSEPEMAGNTLSPMHLNSFSKRNDSFFQRKDVEKQTRVLTRRRSDWDWKRKIFGIGPQTWSTPKSDLIHPESPFAQGVIMMSSLLLVYTAAVIPISVAFYWGRDICDPLPTLNFEVFLDVFFMLEIFVTFFTGLERPGIHGDEYVDTMKGVAWIYLRSGQLPFDVLTSIPVAVMEASMLWTCDGGNSPDAAHVAGLKFVRMLKPLRLLKMLRLVKTVKIMQALDWLESAIRPPPMIWKMLRVFFGIMLIVHITACFYWLIKSLTEPAENTEILLDQFGYSDHDADQTFVKYVLSAYFINSIFTTIGFGDISAVNEYEMIFTIGGMYIGTLVFGTLLSEVQSIVSDIRDDSRAVGRVVGSVQNYLREQKIEAKLEKRILKWVIFDVTEKRRQRRERSVLSTMPEDLGNQVIMQTRGQHLARMDFIWGISSIASVEVTKLITELAKKMVSVNFPQDHLITHRESAQGLYLIVCGVVYIDDGGSRSEGSTRRDTVLCKGQSFGAEALVHKNDAVAEGALAAQAFIARTCVSCLVLRTADFEVVMDLYPPELRQEIEDIISRDLRESRNLYAAELTGDSSSRAIGRWRKLFFEVLKAERRLTSRSGTTQFLSAISTTFAREDEDGDSAAACPPDVHVSSQPAAVSTSASPAESSHDTSIGGAEQRFPLDPPSQGPASSFLNPHLSMGDTPNASALMSLIAQQGALLVDISARVSAIDASLHERRGSHEHGSWVGEAPAGARSRGQSPGRSTGDRKPCTASVSQVLHQLEERRHEHLHGTYPQRAAASDHKIGTQKAREDPASDRPMPNVAGTMRVQMQQQAERGAFPSSPRDSDESPRHGDAESSGGEHH